MKINIQEKLKKITTFIFDVDGVFTDAMLSVGDEDVLRVYNVRDGYAVHIALKAGYRMAIISGGKQKSIEKRLGGLGIKDVYLNVSTDKKLETYQVYKSKYELQDEEILFMGDDIPDLLLMQNTSVFATCPADAVSEVKEAANYISNVIGGKGAVRDVIELVMKAQGKWLTVF
jgi:3-deoxy-D-manno-octulosonate 8-phosphate phosphatase (KDO 8-P phosphatase)